MRLAAVTLERDTPAQLLGLKITICAGQQLTLSRIQNGVVRCYARPSDGWGPSAICPILIRAEHIQNAIVRQERCAHT